MGTDTEVEKSYANLKKLEEKNSEIEFQAEIPTAILEEHMREALVNIAHRFDLPGFRKGKVPEYLVRERVSEMELLENAADSALQNAVNEIIADKELAILGGPQVVITKIALGNPVTFKAKFALYPEVSLPDYKKIGREITERKDSTEATDKEIEAAVDRIRRMFAGQTKEDATAPLPEMTDELVKQLGPFENVDAFRAEVRKQLGQEKEIQILEAKRNEIVKQIVTHSKMKIPQLLVNQELAEYRHSRDEELKKLKLSFEEYLKQSGKTAEALEKEEKTLTEERIKVGFVLREIRQKEGITVEEGEAQATVAHLQARYRDRSEKDLRQTAEAIVVQEKLFAILEGRNTKKSEESAKK